jgi:hypothetical protein
MDPDENLKQQRRLAERILRNEGGDSHEIVRLAELMQALDEWIAGGGFLPAAWRKA